MLRILWILYYISHYFSNTTLRVLNLEFRMKLTAVLIAIFLIVLQCANGQLSAEQLRQGPRKANWDYVVAGLGGGGSSAAHLLAKDGTKSVLVLEEGHFACPACQVNTDTAFPTSVSFTDTNISRHFPVGQAGAFGNSPFQVSYHGPGGSTNLWGGVYNRASKEVLDTFFPPGFKYNDLLPYYKSMEDHWCHYISDAYPGAFPEISPAECLAYHGKGGPMQISPNFWERFTDHMNATFLSVLAGNANNSRMGMPYSADCNGDPQHRAGLTFISTYNMRANASQRTSAQQRGSAFKGWLNQNFLDTHPNLQIVTGARVLRLNIQKRPWGQLPLITGVDFTLDGGATESTVRAGRTILSMGVINTPKFLQLNGIGDAGELAAAGINVVANNTWVGKRLMAHQALLTGYRTTSNVIGNSGEQATMGHFYSNASALTSPDFQIAFGEGVAIETLSTFAAGPPKPVVVSTITNGGVPAPIFISVLIINNRPTVFGSVRVNKRDPTADALIDYGWNGGADFEKDVDRIVQAVENVREFMLNLKFPNGTNLIQEETYPGTLWYDNINKFTPNAQFLPDALKKALSDRFFIMNALHPVYHITGTCSLGYATDLTAQVNGVRNLHVIDNSLTPHAPDGNPSATLFALSQKVVASILAADA